MATIGTLSIGITANTTKFATGIQSAKLGIQKFTAATASMRATVAGAMASIQQMGAIFVPLAGATAIGGLIKNFKNLGREMSKSTAVMGDIAPEMMAKMRAATIQVAKDTLIGTDEAARAYFFLASAGMDAAQSLEAMPIVARFAQAGWFDMARATDLLVGSLNALGLSSKDSKKNLEALTKMGDVLLKANTLAKPSVEQLSEAIAVAAPTARRFGISLEELVSVLAVFGDQLILGSSAGKRFEALMNGLTTRAIKNADAFEKHGIAVFDSQGKLRALADIFDEVTTGIGGMNAEM